MTNEGIIIAGNLIVDYVKMIAAYPAPGRLETITQVHKSIGGCAPNTLIDLAVLSGGAIPLSALGRIGADPDGEFILATLARYGVNVGGVKKSAAPTSFTDVMTVAGGERTFFQCRGANAEFAPADVDLENLHAKIFHLGYLLLLDAFDIPGAAPEFLRRIQQRGIRTSIDAVSENSDRFASVIKPALAFCDYAILNEIEAGKTVGIAPEPENMRDILAALLCAGVKRKAVIHCPAAGYCLDASGKFTTAPSLKLPSS
jgi:sugar/nucleoside kinase (ribokinase family)